MQSDHLKILGYILCGGLFLIGILLLCFKNVITRTIGSVCIVGSISIFLTGSTMRLFIK